MELLRARTKGRPQTESLEFFPPPASRGRYGRSKPKGGTAVAISDLQSP
jgi:hypothetical protein